MTTPREAAFLALIEFHLHNVHLTDSLNAWRSKEKPASNDLHLAQEIAYGTMRMQKTLDYYASQLTNSKKLKLKPKELYLLRSALYQFYFMSKIPLYALTNETVSLAKRYFSPHIAQFFNALLRKLPDTQIEQPTDLTVLYSYTESFVDKLLKHFPKDVVKEILKVGNQPSQTMVRVRNPKLKLSYLKPILKKPFTVCLIEDIQHLKDLSQMSDVYIQNVTPAYLISTLAEKSTISPKTILDLCSSPGGKLIAIHDIYPKATLWSNDVSEGKLEKIKENLTKYGIRAHLTSSRGEELQTEERFDVIIIDAPCSNSGVFNKRPEARWRFTHESLKELTDIQMSLISHAQTLLKPDGEIWYLTCSILPEENDKLTDKAAKKLGMTKLFSEVVLPNDSGWDGGYGAILKIV
jgi:16S rRNA (cytosine967-C5)-methyltransferase